MEKQIEILMELARVNMKDAERNAQHYSVLSYFKGKNAAFEFSYAIIKGFGRSDFWKDEASNEELKQMEKRLNELMENC